MNRLILITGVTLMVNSYLMANELDELKVIDMSIPSITLNQKPIMGCTDENHKKEESCSKEEKDIILSKLPTSKQFSEANLNENKKNKKIQEQLSNILTELSQLKEAQKADRETIKELKGIIKILSNEKKKDLKQKISTIKKSLKKINATKGKNYTHTRIRKPINEISRSDTEVIIEVQNNESLSTYAQYYYDDNTKYYKIYQANKDKINEDLQITIGDLLTIPLQ